MNLRIALFDAKLFETLKAFDVGGVDIQLLRDAREECSADILLLREEELRSAAIHCVSATRPSFVVLVDDGTTIPAAYAEGIADDLLTLPPRRMDLIRLIGLHHHMHALRSLENSSKAIPQLVKKLQEDVQLAQKIQRRLIREKFPAMSGIKVKSKYWCGMKSGGDYFDVFEFPDENHIGFLLSDSSSYSLSNSFLGSLLQFSTHLAAHDPSDPSKILENLFGKMKEEMKEKDQFSILYGILNRKNYQLRTVSCGSLFALHEPANGVPAWIADGKSAPLTKLSKEFPKYTETSLDPEDRLILLSDGWQSSTGESVKSIAERLVPANKDGQDLVNEFAFALHQKSEEPDSMPPEDCSILILEIAKNVLRLARSSG